MLTRGTNDLHFFKESEVEGGEFNESTVMYSS